MAATTQRESVRAPKSSEQLKRPGFVERIYNGEGGLQIVPNRKKWFGVLIALVVLCLAAILIRGFSLGIDFEGGTRLSMPPTNGADETSVSEVFEEATGVQPQTTQIVGSGEARQVEVTSERLSEEQIRDVRTALFDRFQPTDSSGEVTEAAVNDSTVSESWGSSITQRMLIALVVFLLAVFLYITIRLERDMAIAAIICLVIDLIVVAGIYALVGFEVSPATVIGLLTILSFSLYDTVVVFDKVNENTTGLFQSTRSTYAEEVNLAVNQTIMRSLNTTIFSVVPIISLLVIAVGLMGVGTLKDLALVQFLGVIVGTFSSIFFAAPLLVVFKNRSKKFKEHEQRVMLAREGQLGTSSSTVTAPDNEENAESALVGVENKEETTKRQVASPNARVTSNDEDAGRSWRPGM
ncbi:preprotein translocase SecF subunit [Corynebacterium suicordis]|uniref:Protein-export membrane protein SecF n=1 Tax=Corynebacterium suicordis DSM 45110 TaxID=1121369 RepID=A0ABR9ZJD0_9CORY|nr:protein translocase subunit SecF [Corynebacterium suicordis DSM 45110]MDR6277498.1 preprotein translocase SecF subunit [Corynebacterium suicordis]